MLFFVGEAVGSLSFEKKGREVLLLFSQSEQVAPNDSRKTVVSVSLGASLSQESVARLR